MTVICTTCFTVRASMLMFSTVNEDIDVNDAYIMSYYLLAEVLPSALVLFILRKLPPPRRNSFNRLSTDQYDKYGESYNISITNNVNS